MWPFKKKPSIPVPAKSVWNLDRWCHSASHVQWARALFSSGQWQDAWQVLCDEIPRGWPRRGEKQDALQIAMEHGRVEGYWDCLEMLRALTIHSKPAKEDVPADYLTPPMAAALGEEPAQNDPMNEWFPIQPK